MISTVAELLEAFRDQEAKILDQQEIKHAPTIGSMYEGLTKEILARALPEGLNLNVVSGFITNGKGQLSPQIDCMLVEGQGERIPYTAEYKYHIEKVVAIIQVKKNIYSDGLDSAYQNLASIRDLHERRDVVSRLFADAHRLILQSDPEEPDDFYKLPFWKRQVALSLYDECLLPVRIAIGYHGFTSEFSFREAFIQYLSKNLEVSGYGSVDLPNLIIVDKYSLIKLNGMPYGIPIMTRDEIFKAFRFQQELSNSLPITDDLWILYASYPGNPMLLLLELIWTRLVYNRILSNEIFGMDLELEILRPLILAKAIDGGKKIGWNYEYFALGEDMLAKIPVSIQWTPAEISQDHFAVLMCLGFHVGLGEDGVDVNAPDLLNEFAGREADLSDAINYLRKANLVSLEQGKLRYLTRECRIVALPDGRFFAGEDEGGRLSMWVMMNQNKKP